MKRLSKLFASRSGAERPRPLGARRREEGFALLILLMLATVMLIALTAALPSVYSQGQREKEEELIFRGNEYARAIAMFRRQFQRFPTDVKELLETNGMRFLRHEYKDPMTKQGKWRFIHADAAGTPIDSRTIARPKPAKPLGDDRNSAGSATKSGDESESRETSVQQVTEEEDEKQKSSFFGDGKELKGAFIIGVASKSNKNSIRVHNNKTRYSDWEFLGIEAGANRGALPGAGGVPAGGRNPGMDGRPGLPSIPPLSDPTNPTR